MSSKALASTRLYRNVRSGQITKVLSQKGDRTLIATLKGNGETGRTRTVPTSSIHQDNSDPQGKPHTNGYVPLDTAPAEPTPDKNTNRSSMDLDLMDNLDDLDDAQLALVILEQQKIKSVAEELVNRAKAIAKKRRDGNLGIDIQDGIALVYTSGSKFDAGYARRNLSPEDYKRILLAKPDATLARKLFEHEPEKLQACLKDNGATLTVREATDEDKARFAASAPKGDEDYSFEV